MRGVVPRDSQLLAQLQDFLALAQHVVIVQVHDAQPAQDLQQPLPLVR